MSRKVQLLFLLSLAFSSRAEYSIWNDTFGEHLDWWQKAVIYQVFPLSFKDSNGDGYGDINGIIQNANHFLNLGVDAVRLTPVTKSPMKALGYDVSSYVEIHPIFGTMEDFKGLVNKLKELGIKLIMDFIPNHTSDKHMWFQKSVASDPKYKDYYVWVDPVFNTSTGKHAPPNNWISVLGGSAWKYNSERRQYYLHQFEEWQPDLNIRNENVIKELMEVLKFWLDLGVNGFWMDSINHLVEKQGFPDEPVKSRLDPSDINNYDYLDHIYTTNQPESLDVLANFWRQLEKYSYMRDNITRVMITQADGTTTEEIMQQYGNQTHPIVNFPLNFNLIDDMGMSAENFDIMICDWMDRLPVGAWPNWMLGSHEYSRVGSRYNPNLVDGLNMILLLLPGTAITYYGEEIGMIDSEEERINIAGDSLGDEPGQDTNLTVSRYPGIAPLQWSDMPLAGFTKGDKTWFPVNSDYHLINVMDQTTTPKSHYNIYRQLVQLRKLPGVQKGNLEVVSIGTRVLAFKRYYHGEKTGVVVTVNLGEDTLEEVNICYVLDLCETKLKANITTSKSIYKPGDMVNSDSIRLNSFEGLVFTFQQSLASSRSSSTIALLFFISILIIVW
ncbi:maltase 2-like [Hetaerina americana]|uniref:maltase 2-like n=1 Tax=Hetaerina americana TaxID=62018 RepID=UPI003A7F1064